MHRTIRSLVVVSLFAVAGCETEEGVPTDQDGSDELVAALERDLGQSHSDVERRLRAEASPPAGMA